MTRDDHNPELNAKFVVLINQSSTSVSLRAHFGHYRSKDMDFLKDVVMMRDSWIADQFDQFDAEHFNNYYALTITERRTDGTVYTFDGDETRAVFNAALKLASSSSKDDMPYGC
jgi:hypothetical protein